MQIEELRVSHSLDSSIVTTVVGVVHNQQPSEGNRADSILVGLVGARSSIGDSIRRARHRYATHDGGVNVCLHTSVRPDEAVHHLAAARSADWLATCLHVCVPDPRERFV